MRHPFDGINPGSSGSAHTDPSRTSAKHTRRSVLSKMLAAAAGIFGLSAAARACQIEIDPRTITTMMLGEEGGGPITKADIPSEGGGPRPTTLREGEEGGRPRPTTEAVGEEGGRPSTTAAYEEGGRPTTLRTGEEGGSTERLGEEGGGTKLRCEEGGPQPSTRAAFEEGGIQPMTTALIPSETGGYPLRR